MRALFKRIFFPLLFLLSCTHTHADVLPVIDLSGATFEDNQKIEVADNWHFYWNKYLFFGDPVEGGVAVGKNLPWTEIPDKENGFPAFGYGTYALKINLPSRTDTNLAFKMRRVKTAYALYVDGHLVGRMGELDNYPFSLTTPDNNTGVLTFQVPIEKTEISVFIHVSNTAYYRGGLDQPPVLSYGYAANTSTSGDYISAAFISGALLFMGLYHFGLWLKRRQHTTSLYFSILAIAVGVRVFFTYKLFYYVVPSISEELMLRLEISLAFTALPFLHIFISSVFPNEANKYMTRMSWIIWAALMCITLFTNLKIVGEALLPFKLYFVVTLVHNIYMGVNATIKKREGSLLFSFGFIVALITGIHDVLFENNTIYGYGKPIFPFGVLAFVFIQCVLHALHFSRAFRDLEILTNTLEIQVQDRTKELSEAHQEAKKSHEETKYLSNSIINLLEDERKSIARELHDDFGQSIRGAGLYAETISRRLSNVESDNKDIRACIENADKIVSELKEVYQKNRNLLRRLRPEIIDTLGLESAIEELLDNYRRNDYQITFECNADVLKLDNKEKITIYRILQEAITNILKYAETKTFAVSLMETEDQFIFVVSDNGKGFDVSTARGVGLISMRERMTDIGGTIVVQSEVSKGTTITAKFPKNKSI